MANKAELVEEAKSLGIKHTHVMGEALLIQRIAEAKAASKDATVIEVPETSKPIVEKQAKPTVPDKPKTVTFFWKNKQNLTFHAGGRLYATVKSVLKLDPKDDAEAITKLRAHKKNEANKGRGFAELKAGQNANSDKGKTMDELWELDIATLANMVGGSVSDTRKSKGTLVAEIMAMK